MHEIAVASPVVIAVSFFVLGMLFDRFLLWPLAAFLARLDGRVRPR